MDITTAMTINFLFETSNFFKIPININDKPANARISTQKSINPPAIGKTSPLPKRAPATKWGIKNSNTFTKIPKRNKFTPLFIITFHWLCLEYTMPTPIQNMKITAA